MPLGLHLSFFEVKFAASATHRATPQWMLPGDEFRGLWSVATARPPVQTIPTPARSHALRRQAAKESSCFANLTAAAILTAETSCPPQMWPRKTGE